MESATALWRNYVINQIILKVKYETNDTLNCLAERIFYLKNYPKKNGNLLQKKVDTGPDKNSDLNNQGK